MPTPTRRPNQQQIGLGTRLLTRMGDWADDRMADTKDWVDDRAANLQRRFRTERQEAQDMLSGEH